METTRRSFLKGALLLSVTPSMLSACGGKDGFRRTAYDALEQTGLQLHARVIASVNTETNEPFSGRLIIGVGGVIHDPSHGKIYWKLVVLRGESEIPISAGADEFFLEAGDDIVATEERIR